MKLYIEMLNIKRAKDRKALMSEQLKSKNIDANFFEGIDFKETDKKVLEENCLGFGPWGEIQDREMACTASHAKAWKRFLESDSDICLIMEDDIYISEELEKWLNDLSWWPTEAEIIKLECWVEKINGKGKILLENPGKSHLNRKVKKLLTRHMGAAGYLLTRRAAEKLIKSVPLNMVADHILFNMNASKIAKNMEIYQVIPALIIQGNEPKNSNSYTGNRNTKLKVTGMKWLSQELKRGRYEISIPFRTILKYINKTASLEVIEYKNKVI
jgi:glycosyl transferase, family 25